MACSRNKEATQTATCEKGKELGDEAREVRKVQIMYSLAGLCKNLKFLREMEPTHKHKCNGTLHF